MDIVLPKNSLTMTEAEIIEWLVPIGGQVTVGEPLFVMETDKSQVEVEAVASGTLTEILAQPGDTPLAGDVIARMDSDSDSGNDRKFATAATADNSVAPAAAELAEQLGIDISTIRGSGSGGRVIEEDVLKAVASPLRRKDAAEKSSTTAPSTTAAPGSKKRQAGNRSTQWATDVPTFYVSRTLQLPPTPEGSGASDVLVAAVSAALRQVPIANAVAIDGQAHTYNDVRVGILVREGDALIPLVFADADKKPLKDLHTSRRKMMADIEAGTLDGSATAWPTFVISNIGRKGVNWFTAVLFPGTAATLAIGGLSDNNTVEAVLTCDHRVLDGVDGADFLDALASSLEQVSK